MNRLLSCLIFFSIAFYPAKLSLAAESNFLRTKYTTIYYERDKDLSDFLFKIGGTRFELPEEKALATSRIDRIVDRVEAILDMHPKNLNIKIYLAGALVGPNETAFYEYRTKSIHVAVGFATDGIVAHEIAHAVINRYFSSPPPGKVQEILTQYVDKYLWSDY
jgi:hypothetical protein